MKQEPDTKKTTPIAALLEAQVETDRLRAALIKIKRMKSEPIGDTGFSVGPASLFAICQRIAREALKNVKR